MNCTPWHPLRWIPLFMITLFIGALSAYATDVETQKEGYQLPAKGPMTSQLREDLSDEVEGPETVVRKYEDDQGNQVREFLINGYLFQIEVIPFHGPSYFLVDTTGDGLFDSRFNGHKPRLIVPQWVLFRF